MALQKLQLVLEIDGDKAVVSGFRNVDQAIDNTSRTTTTATGKMAAEIGNVETATGRMAAAHVGHMRSVTSSMSEVEQGIQSVTNRIFNLTMAAGLIATPFIAATVAIKKGVEVVDDFALSNIQIAAQITQMQGPKGVADNYKKASEYAAVLSLKLEEMDANSLANNKGLMAMTQTMVMQGVLLDVNNKKQVDAATAISNAIAAYTKGQDQQLQFYQETRALMSGQVDMRAQVSKAIDQAIKQEGEYKDGLKEVVELGKQHGDLLERLQPYLVGMNEATADINKTWTAATSSMETTISLITRAGFSEVYRDAVDWLQKANVYLREHSTEIGGSVKDGWRNVKGLIEGSVDLLNIGIVGSLPILKTVVDEVKFITNGITGFFDVLRQAPGLLAPIGVAAFYAVGGIAAFETAYISLTTVIAASMASNPIGWIVLGITAIVVAAQPAIKYMDELLQKYSGFAEAQKNAADADTNWENEKKRQRWMYEEGGKDLRPSMMKELGIVATPKIAPPKPEESVIDQDKYKQDLERSRESYLHYSKAFDDRQIADIKNQTTLQLLELKSRHDQGLVTQQQYLNEKYELDKAAINKDENLLLTAAIKAQAAADAADQTMLATRTGGVYDAGAIVRRNKALEESEKAWKTVEAAENKALETDSAFSAATGLLNFKKAMELEGQPDNADNWDKMYKAAAKSMEEFTKKQAALSRLNLDNQLAEINAAEKFYEITAGAAAEKRISLLEEALALDKEAYANAGDNELLQAELRKSIIGTNTQLLEQKKILADSTAIGGAISALQEYGRAATDVGAQTKGVVTDFLKGMEDALVSFVKDGKLSFRSLVDSMISDIARMAVKQSITGPLSNWLVGLMSGNGSSASSGSINWGGLVSGIGFAISGAGNSTGWSWLSSIGSGLTGLGSGAGAAAGSAAGSYGVLASDAGYTWGSSAIGGASASAGASAGSGAAGSTFGGLGYGPYAAMAVYTYQWLSDYLGSGGIWNQHTTDQKMQMGSANTLTAGAAWWIDYLSGGGAFGTNWRPASQGYQLGVANGDVSAQGWTLEQKKKSLWRGTDSRYVMGAYDDVLAANLQTTLDSIINSVVHGSRTLGGDTSMLRNLNISSRMITLGPDNAANMAQFTSFFKDATNDIIKALYPSITDFVKKGETVTDTFNRLTMSLNTANDFLTAIGGTLYDISIQGAAASQALIDALGGTEKAQTAFNNYLGSSLFTDAERKQAQYEVAQNAVNRTFNDIGLAVPQTTASFKDLVKSALAAGESGAYTATALLEIAPAFGTMMDYINAGQQTALDTAKANFDLYQMMRQSALDSISSITGGALSMLSPEQKYAQAQATFNNASLLAAAGDTTAMQGLPGVVTKFLEASKSYNASTDAYGNDYAAGLAALQGVVNYSDIQMYPTSAPVTGSADNRDVVDAIKNLQTEMAKVVSKLGDIEGPLKRVVNAAVN
ncbi:MAG: hypothetical protein HXX17_11985 [Geobacteraceae bacterium]|nr:hypothetical protein [Geobacteraceae bacterium]